MADQNEILDADLTALIDASAHGVSIKSRLELLIGHLEIWQRAAGEDDPRAHCLLGRCYEEGAGVEPDPIVALAHYRAASDQGHALGHFCLGRLLERGRGMPADAPRARALYTRAAAAEISLAQVNLSLMMQQGRGGPVDHAAALIWMRRAADQGNVVAQCNLGVLLESGEGIEHDPEAARALYLAAAQAHYGPACFCLGLMVQETEGAAQAVPWFEQGANLGDAASQYMFGTCLLEGEGVEQDVEAGARWLRHGAIADDADAAWRYGLCLMTGEGVEADPEEGVRWLRRAARSEQVDALYALGVAYARGDGVDQDMHAALDWFTRARKAGHPQAAEAEQAAKDSLAQDKPMARAKALPDLLRQEDMPPRRWQLEAAHIIDAASKGDAEYATALMQPLLDTLTLEDPARAHFGALLIGALIEQGADPLIARRPLTDRLLQSLDDLAPAIRLMEALDPQDDEDLHEAQLTRRLEALREARPAVAHLWDQLDALCRAVVTICSVHRPMAHDLAERAVLMAQLEAAAPFHTGLRDIHRLLTAPQAAPLRVIMDRVVYELQVTGVVDLFQLHVLLVDLLLDGRADGGDPLMPPSVVATAKGEGPQRTEDTVEGIFDLYAWRALPDVLGGLAVHHRLILAHALSPLEIPEFEGMPTLILAPATLTRAWSNVRYFDRLPARLHDLRPLPRAEGEAIIERVLQAASIRH